MMIFAILYLMKVKYAKQINTNHKNLNACFVFISKSEEDFLLQTLHKGSFSTQFLGKETFL